MKKIGKGFYVYLALVVVAPMLLFLLEADYYLSLLVYTGIHAIVAIGLCIVMGMTGQISIGQAAFWGIGAYTSAILTSKYEISPFLALIAAAIIPSVIAFILARAIAGLSGYYLAMATLAFGYIVQILINEWESVTGGATGMIGIPPIDFFGESELGMYCLVWGVVTIILLFSLNLVESRVGRAFRAIHKSEIAATSMGIDVRKYRLLAFVVGGLFAGLSGGLYAHYTAALDPQPFGFHESIVFITIVVIGGMTNIWGALVGTIIIEVIRSTIAEFPAISGDIETIIYGAILVLIIMFMPEGLVPKIQSMFQSFKLRRKDQRSTSASTSRITPTVVVQKNEERETVR